MTLPAENRVDDQPKAPHGGPRQAGPGKKIGRPKGSTKPPEQKAAPKSATIRIRADLWGRAAAAGGESQNAREVIEQLLDKHLPKIKK